ncbi:response regulator [Alteromonas ponticola]|uniref:Response regulator n=1 Tax=Alteromonas ponticola TaxID=2720613 RepID=A0ABX1R5Q0_9ALTE|nr:response regulator [Alteromonas ponticola]NMH61241.1 response regulator [Alteromonas ponticola]
MKPVLSVLVVENSPLIASKITSFLAGLGWQVDYAASGKMALYHSKCHHYDVVLVNTNLPDMTFQEVHDNLVLFTEPQPSVLLMSDGKDFDEIATDMLNNIIPNQNDMKDIVSRCHAALSQRAAMQPATAIAHPH